MFEIDTHGYEGHNFSRIVTKTSGPFRDRTVPLGDRFLRIFTTPHHPDGWKGRITRLLPFLAPRQVNVSLSKSRHQILKRSLNGVNDNKLGLQQVHLTQKGASVDIGLRKSEQTDLLRVTVRRIK